MIRYGPNHLVKTKVQGKRAQVCMTLVKTFGYPCRYKTGFAHNDICRNGLDQLQYVF